MKRLEGCKCEGHDLERLDEARLLGNLHNLAKCGISGSDVKNDIN